VREKERWKEISASQLCGNTPRLFWLAAHWQRQLDAGSVQTWFQKLWAHTTKSNKNNNNDNSDNSSDSNNSNDSNNNNNNDDNNNSNSDNINNNIISNKPAGPEAALRVSQ
jgi:hypothetical protein